MYEELIKLLREAPSDWYDADLHYEAADAIEELNREYESIAASLNESVELVRKLRIPLPEPPKEG